MKRKYSLSIITLLLLSIATGTTSCTTNNNSNSKTSNSNGSTANTDPTIDGVEDLFLELENSGTFDVFNGGLITAWDVEDGDLSSDIIVYIEDNFTGDEVEKIYLNSPGEYTITYEVSDSKGYTAIATCTVTVGDPYATDVENPCPATGYRYDLNELDYKLVWSDEFDYEGGVDTSVWSYETGNGNWGWGNGEKEFYTNRTQNVEVKNGELRITALKESYGGCSYTSGRIISKGKKSFKYGKFEASIKMPQGTGTWPAFWLLSNTGRWPSGGEIDIVEAVGYMPNYAYGTAHSADRNGQSNTGRGSFTIVDTMYTDYHIYGVEWLPDGLRFYVDDTVYYEYFPGKQVECPTTDMWPFSDSEFYIIFNLAIGGQWGGVMGIDDTIFSNYDVSMYVDYVRVYQSDVIKNIA